MSKRNALVVVIAFIALAACTLVAAFLLIRTPQGPSETEAVTLIHNFYDRPQGTLDISVKGKGPCALPADKNVSEKWSVVYTNGASNLALRATIALQRRLGNWEWAPFEGCAADLPY
jgi:hypothetical protein